MLHLLDDLLLLLVDTSPALDISKTAVAAGRLGYLPFAATYNTTSWSGFARYDHHRLARDLVLALVVMRLATATSWLQTATRSSHYYTTFAGRFAGQDTTTGLFGDASLFHECLLLDGR